MKLRILRPYLDFEKGKEYEVKPEATAKYLIAMGIGKEVTSKDGKPQGKEKKEVKHTAKKADVKPTDEDLDDLS